MGAPFFVLSAHGCLEVFRHQRGMFSETIAIALDLDDHGVVEEAVEECGGDDAIAEDLSPLCEASVACEGFLVSGVDQLEEQLRSATFERQVSHFVDDEQCRAAQEATAPLEHSFPFRLEQGGDDLGEGWPDTRSCRP